MNSEEIDSIDSIVQAVERLLIEKQIRRKPLTHSQLAILRGSLNYRNLSYEEIAEENNYAPTGLKETASKLWRNISNAVGVTVNKKNCQSTLIQYFRTPPSDSQVAAIQDRELSPLIGRQRDLEELTTALFNGHYIITICAPAGWGKTELCRHLLRRVRDTFEHVVLCHASEVLSPLKLYGILSQRLNNNAPVGEGASIISGILRLLRQKKCLIVIEETEILYCSHTRAGIFREESRGYQELLSRLAEDFEQKSCVLWVSQEACSTFPTVTTVYNHDLKGISSTESQALVKRHLHQRELTGTEADWQQFTEFCGGSPKLLQTLAEPITQFYEGGIADFLAATSPKLGTSATTALQKLVQRVSPVENTVLYWLMLQPSTYQELVHLSSEYTSERDLYGAWESLTTNRRLLVREDKKSYRLHPPAQTIAVAQQFVALIVGELKTAAPRLLHQYPLLQVTAPAYRQAWQHQHVLDPIAHEIQEVCREEQHLIYECLRQMLMRLKEDGSNSRSYAAGNILNIAGVLGLSMAETDFSNLPIRQADLRKVNLESASMQNCIFVGTIFPEGLVSPLTTALSPDGRTLAIGDAVGHVLRYKQEGEVFQLSSSCCLSQGVTALTFGTGRNTALLIAVEDEIYAWWQEASPVNLIKLQDTSAPVSCLAQGTHGRVAVGLANGQVVYWDDLDTSFLASLAHTTPVQQLAFSPDGSYLSSRGGDCILTWQISIEEGSLSKLDEIFPNWSNGFLAMSWDQAHLLLAETERSRISLHRGETLLVEFDMTEGNVLALSFSSNSNYLAGSSDIGTVCCWETAKQGEPKVFSHFSSPPLEISLNHDGQYLLTNTKSIQAEVQLWEVERRRCLWKIQPSSIGTFWLELNLQGAQGISEPAQTVLRELGAVF
ncbi:hypothetical protein H6G00_11825 [Leptolyngbya sp. FACHB-541]|uniref:hypothetical protein n=1 Tax=Leptolyngbya sp. FACHB-541 TaxID=2692810 RepID=UPI001685FACD|nr:hypothetical protein [Leptolyngbya sp. FACHB-541]MBD1997308.1 hypothetical protein [Leptolyngbya sp. FACHB-541]